MNYLKAILAVNLFALSATSGAVEVPSGRLVTATIDSCNSAVCQPCYYIEPSLEHACSDDFGHVDYTDFRNSLGLSDFNPQCIRHDSCYQVLGNTKAGCEIDFKEQMYEACSDTYISAVPSEIRNLINNSGGIGSEAERLILATYNRMLNEATGVSGHKRSASGLNLGSIDITNPLDNTPLDNGNDWVGDALDDLGEDAKDAGDDIADVITNPLDGTILDEEKFTRIGEELAMLEDSIRDLIDDVNLVKYYMCRASADLMVMAVAAGPGSITGFDMYQRDAIALTTKQQNTHSCPIDDLQIVDADNRDAAIDVIQGIYESHHLNISDTQLGQYAGVWDTYGKLAFGQASEDADRVYKAVIMIPALSVLIN